ncbi:AraC family transcriptional regulator [Massilia aurea]|nr:AraC family transcriptional regulator [Massilia aurea]
MLRPPPFMRDRPDLPSDPLSDVLALLQVRSGAALHMTAGGPWALRFPAYPYLKFIAQLRGVLFVQVEGDAHPYRLEAGDCLLMRSGRPYIAATDLTLSAQDGAAHFAALRGGAATWGDPNAADGMEMIAGRFEFDASQRDLLEQVVPPELHIPADAQAAPALRALLDLYGREAGAPDAGARLVTDGLARIALVQALREPGGARHGWLAALADPKIGPALRLLHGAPERRWSVEELARETAMSRSALAQRFRQLVGMAPLQYLQAWRMRLARKALHEEDTPLAAIAWRLGYASESAFSAAFKRSSGSAPGAYRQQKRVVSALNPPQ